jgi:hypothetical protein
MIPFKISRYKLAILFSKVRDYTSCSDFNHRAPFFFFALVPTV